MLDKIINQHFIAELLKTLKNEISGEEFDIKEMVRCMKEKLTKSMYSVLRKNQDLIDFMLRYK